MWDDDRAHTELLANAPGYAKFVRLRQENDGDEEDCRDFAAWLLAPGQSVPADIAVWTEERFRREFDHLNS